MKASELCRYCSHQRHRQRYDPCDACITLFTLWTHIVAVTRHYVGGGTAQLLAFQRARVHGMQLHASCTIVCECAHCATHRIVSMPCIHTHACSALACAVSLYGEWRTPRPAYVHMLAQHISSRRDGSIESPNFWKTTQAHVQKHVWRSASYVRCAPLLTLLTARCNAWCCSNLMHLFFWEKWKS